MRTTTGVNLGGLEVRVSLPDHQLQRLRKTAAFRYLLQPTARWIRGIRRAPQPSSNGKQAAQAPARLSVEGAALQQRIAGIEWYHTIELPHGVVSAGFVDHRQQLARYELPADMHGMRALDVATYDGFWAFEMERRGAAVTAIDIGSWAEFDIPRQMRPAAERSGAAEKITGQGFRLAHELLGSRVERHVLSVYQLAPERLGTFDFVFLSDLLLHLRDPQLALENICSVMNRPGTAVIAEVYNPDLEGFRDIAVTEFAAFGEYVWWRPSTATLVAMMRLAGFDRVEEIGRFQLQARAEAPIHKVVLRGQVDPQAGKEDGHDTDA
jgi:tRNA (mo5U34)-methyltransferase